MFYSDLIGCYFDFFIKIDLILDFDRYLVVPTNFFDFFFNSVFRFFTDVFKTVDDMLLNVVSFIDSCDKDNKEMDYYFTFRHNIQHSQHYNLENLFVVPN